MCLARGKILLVREPLGVRLSGDDTRVFGGILKVVGDNMDICNPQKQRADLYNHGIKRNYIHQASY